MILVTTTDSKTDEDTDATSKATRILVDSCMKKPPAEERAITAYAEFVNNGMYADGTVCDMASAIIFKNRTTIFKTGKSVVLHFEDGKMRHRTKEEETVPFGLEPEIGRIDTVEFGLNNTQNALLLCSGELMKLIDIPTLERLLAESKTQEEWRDAIIKQAGNKRQYCFNAFFLPPKRRPFEWLLRKKP